MPYPPLVNYPSEGEYRNHFDMEYCRGPITTHDGIEVRFRRRDFNHCFFETVHSKDDTFSRKRAERISWIKAALQDASADQFQGWDKKRRRYDTNWKVILVQGNYVVVIKMKSASKADFMTAYVADTPAPPGRMSTAEMIRNLSPRWT